MEEIVKYLFESYKLDNGDIKKKGQRKVMSESDVVKELGSYADDNDFEWSKKEREEAVLEWKKKIHNLKSQPKSDYVFEFITHIFKERNIKIEANQKYFLEDIQVDEGEITTILEAKMFDWNREYEDQKISAPELKAKLKDISRETSFSIRKELIESLRYVEDAKIEEWLNLSHKALKIVEDYKIYSTMVKHWVWMVKRKMLAKPTKNQFVLNFFGAPGCGKSFFVKLMTSPLEQFRYNNADLNSIQDERAIPSLGSNFIHFLDELCTGTNKIVSSDQELAKIKNIITADTDFKYRPMGSNAEQKITPKTSLIAASNFHVFDVILDSSGMRRWFEFNVGLESNRYNVEQFDIMRRTILDLWIGVNENEEEGYLIPSSEVGKKVFEIQESYVRKDSFALWLDSVNISQGTMKGPDAHQMYKEYCMVEGMEHKTKQIQSFYSRLASVGVEKHQKMGYTYIKSKITPKTEKEIEIKSPSPKLIERKSIIGFD